MRHQVLPPRRRTALRPSYVRAIGAGVLGPVLLEALEARQLLSASTGATMDLASLPPTAQAAVAAALGQDQPGYQATAAGSGVALANPANAFAAGFQAGTLHIASGSDTWDMTLTAAGYGTTPAPVGQPQISTSGNRVDANYGGSSEWLINSPVGLEQGFTVDPAAPGESPALTVQLALGGNLSAAANAAHNGLVLTRANGATALGYTGLNAWDATGKVLPATLQVQNSAAGQELSIQVDTTGAQGRITIDPWLSQGMLTVAGLSNDAFGWSAAVDGNTMVIGAQYATVSGNGYAGKAFVFTRSGATWTQAAVLTSATPLVSQGFGSAVAISGNTIVVGAQSDTGRTGVALCGAVYVFTGSGATWSQVAKLITTDSASYDFLGSSVALDGDTIVAGAYGKTQFGNSNFVPGYAYVFTKPAAGWQNMTETAKLSASNPTNNAQFGYSVALSGNTIAVGGQNTHAAYIFVKPGATWTNMTETTRVVSPAGAGIDDYFSYSVALVGDTLVAGAPQTTVGANANQGAVYVFHRSGTTWTQTAKITAADGGVNDYFGFPVALSPSNAMVIGAPNATRSGQGYAGAAYEYTLTGSSWTQFAAWTSSAIAAGDGFGSAVAISSRNTVAIGVPEVNSSDPGIGVAFAYQGPSVTPYLDSATATGLGATSATLAGNVTSDGGADLTVRGILYAPTAVNPDPTLGGTGVSEIDDSSATPGAFSAALTTLTAGTSYSFVAYATNTVGTAYSPVSTFTTPAPTAPVVAAPTATAIASRSATLGGTVSSDGGATLTARGILYAPTSVNSNPLLGGTGVLEVDDPSATTGAFTAAVTGLLPGTGYSYVAFATNGVGTTYTSPVSTFTAPAAAPTLTAPTATSVTATGAVLGGTLTDDGGASITKRGILYALTADNSNPTLGGPGVTEVDDGSTALGTFTETISGLTDLRDYSYVAFAVNSAAASYTSPVSTFSTPSAIVPTTTTVTATQASTVYGSALTFTATVAAATGNAAPPQGSVDFMDTTTGHDFGIGVFGSSSGTSATWTLAVTASAAGGLNVTAGDTITATYTPGDGFSDSNGVVTQAVTAAPLTITAQDFGKTYDGNAYSGGNGVAYNGFVAGEDQAALGGMLSFSGNSQGAINAGTYTLTPGGLTSSNYAITFVDGTLTVGRADATLIVTGYSTSYDGTAHSAVANSTGVRNEPLSGLDLAGTTHTNAGTYTGDAWTFTDTTGNYNNASGTVDDSIATAAVTLTADTSTKVYGQRDPALAYTLTAGQLFATDTFNGALTRAPGENVGTYPIGQGTLAAGSNYTLTFVADNFSITPAAVVVTPDNQAQVYGGTQPALTATITGLQFEQTTLPGLVLATAPATSHAGTYNITAAATDSNYTVTFNTGTLTITPASLTVTVDNQTTIYGASIPALTYTVNGLVNGDTSLARNPTLATTATVATPAGTYDITASGAVGNDYAITYVPGTLTITRSSSFTTLITSAPTGSASATPVTFTATVGLPGTGVASGTISFYDGTTLLGTAPLNSVAQAALTTSSLGLNSHQITAVYSGDANLQPSVAAAVTQFIGSAHERYVEQLYHDLLRRTVDAGGFRDWVAMLDNGAAYQVVARGIETSVERDQIMVADLYQQLLGRAVDRPSLDYWVGQMRQGLTVEIVAANVLGSAEYISSHGGGDPLQFLESLYQDVLGRDLDGVGRTVWGGLLANGAAASAVAFQVINSAEGMAANLTRIYNLLLLRAPEPFGLTSWTNFTNANADPQFGPSLTTAIYLIASAPEYFTVHQIPWQTL